MQLSLTQLASHLAKDLKPIYVLHGDAFAATRGG